MPPRSFIYTARADADLEWLLFIIFTEGRLCQFATVSFIINTNFCDLEFCDLELKGVVYWGIIW